MRKNDLSDVCEELAKKTYNFLKSEIEKISESKNLPEEESLKLGLGTTAFLSAVMIDIMRHRNFGQYKEEYFYHDVSIILNKLLINRKE